MSRETMIDGMATILWGSAWADHVEECGCANLSGCEITEIMPDIPKEAREHAERIAATYEKMNGCTLEALYQRAVAADNCHACECADSEDCHIPHTCGVPANRRGPERFGECLAWEAMGAGVGWDDDHAEYAHEHPYDAGVASCDLMYLAETTCDECKAKRRTYTVLSLDMWGHVPADCDEDCPCTKECDFCTEGVDDSSWSGPRSRASCTTCSGKGYVHDDDKCECSEDCNAQYKCGTIDVRNDEDTTILDALLEGKFLSEQGRAECVIDDYTDGTMLDVNDKDGRRIFALQLEGDG